MKDFVFGICLWIGTWSIFDWIASFHVWLDNTLPWRLRYRLKAMWEENKSLCTQLQTSQWENVGLKCTVREAVSKMNMPIAGGRYPMGKLYAQDEMFPFPMKTITCEFERYRTMIRLDVHSFPHYSADLLDYMAQHTADQIVGSATEHVYKEVKKFYEKEFLNGVGS